MASQEVKKSHLGRRMIATFFGVGYIPGPGGTYASAVTAALAIAAYYGGVPLGTLLAITVFITVVSVLAGRGALEDFAQKDPHEFVLDEVAGQLIASTALWLPWTLGGWPWAVGTTAVAFFWFRVCDILKPPPARQAESLPHGWGITMDDVIAGVMALGLTIACQAIASRVFEFPPYFNK